MIAMKRMRIEVMSLSDTLQWGSRMMRSSANGGDELRDMFGFDAVIRVNREVPEGTFFVVGCVRCGQEINVPQQVVCVKNVHIDHECPDVVAKDMEFRAGRGTVRQRIATDGDGD